MYFRLFSDIHLEFGSFTIPHLDTDSDTVLVLAGDIAVASKPNQYQEFILDAVSRFKHVIWIPGNHEHYHGSMVRSLVKMKRACGEHPNLSIINNETVVLDNVAFVCSTLWTDLANGNPLMMMQVEAQFGGMTDYKLIRIGPKDLPYKRKIRAEDILREHKIGLKFITEEIANQHELGRKVVVVTHHGPSWQSIDAYFHGDSMNAAYVSALDGLILDLQPAYWLHGHVHCAHDYNIENTNVLVNPRGYVGQEYVPDFQTEWIVEL